MKKRNDDEDQDQDDGLIDVKFDPNTGHVGQLVKDPPAPTPPKRESPRPMKMTERQAIHWTRDPRIWKTGGGSW